MTNNTVSAASGAMSKIDRADVMRRAWAIFRRVYKFPTIKFNDIGRKCFAWALKQAWAAVREVSRLAAMPATTKAERVAALQANIALASYIECGPQWKATVSACRAELRALRS